MGAWLLSLLYTAAFLSVALVQGQERQDSPARLAAAASFGAVRVASGLSQPIFVTAPVGDTTHLYIVQQGGQILVMNRQTNAISNFFTVPNVQNSGEQGLLGMAFDPNFASNGKFYVDYVVPGGSFGNGTTHISQFTSAVATPTPTPTPKKKKKKKKKHTPTPTPIPGEKVLLTFDHPQTNHNGGWIGFSSRSGDANNLYIATGDGGNGNDQGPGHIEPGGNAQNTTTLLGKMLRIHVDAATGVVSIPADNPFANATGATRQEIFAFGLRNPFRDSFDAATGRLFIGDVGQDTREEIDVQQATNPGGGENYGWRLREGSIATPTGNPAVGGSPPPGNVNPILDYGRSVGGTVIGGYVYHGQQIPALQGKYVFGDYLAGKIFTLDYDGTTASNFTDITSQLFPSRNGGFTPSALASFGVDAMGEIYIIDIGGGAIYKIVP